MKTVKLFLILFVALFAFGMARAQEITSVKVDDSSDDDSVELEVRNEEENTGIEHEDIGITDDDDNDGIDDDNEMSQHNQSDMEFIHEHASDVSVKAVEVRGWDDMKKEELLETVKLHAQVKSQQDLENFAAGVLLKDENVIEIKTEEEEVEIEYKMPAKLLGFIPSGIPVRARVELDGDSEDRVRVRFPWFRFLFSLNNNVKAGTLDEAIGQEIDDEVLVAFEHGDAESDANGKAQLMQILSNVMKTAHEAAKNAVNNIR